MISGLQKMTLLDYPGKVACTVFLQGCNLRCPFCHNTDLLPHEGEALMTEDALLDYLRRRRGLLDAVCISGGEPTLEPGLEQLLREIHGLGFAVKLDTNGSRPEVLKRLVSEGLVDYVAMDVKNSPERYAETAGLPRISLEPLKESLRFLMTGAVGYELRTTVVEGFHDERSVREMGEWLCSLDEGRRPAKLFLQYFVDRESVAYAGLQPPAEDAMRRYVEILQPYAEYVAIRGEG